jgi:peptide/nickel transport system substrate-binding protein
MEKTGGRRRAMRSTLTRALSAVAVLVTTVAGGLVAMTGSAGTAGASGSAATLNISDEYGATWTCQFNPFDATTEGFSFGPVYEELAFEDRLKPTQITPWLATHWAWSNGNKTLTFTIRKGVTWSSGKPFTAADVVFTFNLLKAHAALDLNSDWSVLSSVTQKGTDQVVFQFKTAAVPYFFFIATDTPIVPQYIWSGVSDPTTFLDPHPIGTGPYLMSKCTGSNQQFTANPHYWQKGLPRIKTVNFPSYLSNTPANADLASGKDQWGSQFIPNIDRAYIAKTPKNFHYWFEPVSDVSIFINLKNSVLSNLAVRKAMAFAVNRARAAEIGEYGEEVAANQNGIELPTFKTLYDTSLAKKYGYTYDPKKAISILEAAGYKPGPTGIMQKNGQKLSFTIINNGGYSDWVAAVNVLQSDLKAVGIQITPVNESYTTWVANVYAGHFDLAYEDEPGGPGPYYELYQMLYSANTAPIGQTASSDWERYSTSHTDALFNEYAATTSVTMQRKIIDDLQQVMLSDVPVIPITAAPGWYQYDTKCFGGWVTPQDPYASPAQYNSPTWGVVLLHLYPKSSC